MLQFEEYLSASPERLTKEAKQLWDQAAKQNFTEPKMAMLQEAQFYISEIERRQGNEDVKRSHRMEMLIVWLIVGELALAATGIWLDIKSGGDEVRVLERIEKGLAPHEGTH